MVIGEGAELGVVDGVVVNQIRFGVLHLSVKET